MVMHFFILVPERQGMGDQSDQCQRAHIMIDYMYSKHTLYSITRDDEQHNTGI